MSRRHASNSMSRVRTPMLVIAMLAALVATAALPVVATAQGTNTKAFDQEVWQLLEYANAEGRLEPVPPGVGVEFNAWAGEVFGKVACGEYKAPYDLKAANLLIQGPAIEPVACDPAAQAVDDAFFRALDQAASIDISASILTLSDVTQEPLLRFTSAIIPDDPTLARWEIARIGGADGASGPVIPTSTEPWIEFLRGGRFVGKAGSCGSFYGSYQILDLTVELTEVNSRLGDCPDKLGAQAEAILANLDDIERFQLRPAGLTLEDADGDVRLAMVPELDLGSRIWTPVHIVDSDGAVTVEADRLETSAIRFSGANTGKGDADGRTSCRRFDGDSLVSGLALSVDVTTLEDGKCAKGLKDVEKLFLDGLRKTASHALRGEELELFDGNDALVMRLVPQADLVGPTWVLAERNRGRGAGRQSDWQPAVGEAEVTADFLQTGGTGVIVGETGVIDQEGRPNTYNANFKLGRATEIDISKPSLFGKGCKGSRKNKPACVQQKAFLESLALADTVIVEPDSMRLLFGGRPLLRFTRQSAALSE